MTITVLYTVPYFFFLKGIASKRSEQGQNQKEEAQGIRVILDLLYTGQLCDSAYRFSTKCWSTLCRLSS